MLPTNNTNEEDSQRKTQSIETAKINTPIRFVSTDQLKRLYFDGRAEQNASGFSSPVSHTFRVNPSSICNSLRHFQHFSLFRDVASNLCFPARIHRPRPCRVAFSLHQRPSNFLYCPTNKTPSAAAHRRIKTRREPLYKQTEETRHYELSLQGFASPFVLRTWSFELRYTSHGFQMPCTTTLYYPKRTCHAHTRPMSRAMASNTMKNKITPSTIFSLEARFVANRGPLPNSEHQQPPFLAFLTAAYARADKVRCAGCPIKAEQRGPLPLPTKRATPVATVPASDICQPPLCHTAALFPLIKRGPAAAQSVAPTLPWRAPHPPTFRGARSPRHGLPVLRPAHARTFRLPFP